MAIDFASMNEDDAYAAYGFEGIRARERAILAERQLHHDINESMKKMTQENENDRVQLHSGDVPVDVRYFTPPLTDTVGIQRREEENLKFIRAAKCRYTVASGCAIDTTDGRLTPGSPCDLARHLGGSQKTANRLVALRVLLELDPSTLAARTCTARYLIGSGMFKVDGPQAVVLRTGIRQAGDGVTPADFARDGIPSRLDLVTGERVAGTPPDDGSVRFAELIASGGIIDRGPEFGAHYSGGPEPTPAKSGKAA